MAAMELSYYAQLIRKPEAEYLLVEFDPDWPAAGTASILDTKAATTVFGYQVLAGVDYALIQRTSMGVTARWARFDDVSRGAQAGGVRPLPPPATRRCQEVVRPYAVVRRTRRRGDAVRGAAGPAGWRRRAGTAPSQRT